MVNILETLILKELRGSLLAPRSICYWISHTKKIKKKLLLVVAVNKKPWQNHPTEEWLILPQSLRPCFVTPKGNDNSQGQGLEVAGFIGSTVKKQRAMNPCAWLFLLFIQFWSPAQESVPSTFRMGLPTTINLSKIISQTSAKSCLQDDLNIRKWTVIMNYSKPHYRAVWYWSVVDEVSKL